MWKSVAIIIFLAIFATVEISLTGVLYDRLGTKKLMALYFVTTIFGAVLLLCISDEAKRAESSFRRLAKSKYFKKRYRRPKRGETFNNPKDQQLLFLGIQQFLYTFGWVLILLPGLVTDVTSYVFVLAFIIISTKRKKALTRTTSTPTAGRS